MDPVEEMLKTLEQMRLINREAQQSLKRLETVTLEDSRRGQRQWSIATAATQMPKQSAQPYPVKPADAGPAPIPLAPARPTLNPLALAPTGPPTYGLKDPNAVPLAPQTPAGPTPAANPYALQQVPQKIADSCDCFKDALAPLIALTEKIFAGVKAITGQINKAGYGGGFGGGGGGDDLKFGRDYDRVVSSKDVIDTSLKGQIDGAVKSVTGSLGMMAPVVTAATQAFTSLTGQIGKFVEAVNPALMTAFAAAMRDLNATIGVALEPLMSAALAVARQFGAVLLPVMEQFRPIMEQVASQLVKLVQPYMQFIQELIKTSMPLVQLIADLSRAFQPLVSIVYGTLVNVLKVFAAALTPIITIINLVASVLTPVLKVFEMISKITGSLTTVLVKFTSQIANVLISLSPLGIILKGLAAAGEMLTPVFEAIGVVVEAFSGAVYAALEGIGTWLKGLMGGGDWMDSIKSAFQQLAIGIVVVTAHLAKMVGWMGYIDSLRKTLGGGVDRKDATGRAAATNQQIGGLDSLRQSVMKASLLAGPQGMKTEEQTWRDKTLAELEKMNTGEDMVTKFMGELQAYLNKQVPIWIGATASATVDTTKTMTKDAIKKGAGVADRAAGGVFSAIGRLAGF